MSSFCLAAQNNDTKKADKQFSRFEFVKAAEGYKKLVEKGKGDTYIYGQLAESYYNIFNTLKPNAGMLRHWRLQITQK